jgi:hypothetical protein
LREESIDGWLAGLIGDELGVDLSDLERGPTVCRNAR